MGFLARLGRDDLGRILRVPRREGPPEDLDTFAESLRRPGGTWQLKPAQALALWDLREYGSAIGLITVGGGKTLVASLAATVAGTEGRTALLVPPDLAAAFDAEFRKYEPHFRVSRPTVLRYSMLSRETGIGMLEAHDPDLIVLDEAHYVRARTSARTKRFRRYLKRRADEGRPVRVLAMSGTLIRSTVLDFAEFGDIALGERSPFPVAYSTRESWSRVLDPGPDVADARDRKAFRRLVEWAGPDATPRSAFRERLRTTPGVVVSLGSSCDASIVIRRREAKIGEASAEALKVLADRWELPCGVEVVEATEVSAQASRLAWGYYYRWAWGEDGPDYEWLDLRRRYYAAVRDALARGWEGIETTGLLEKHADAGTLPPGSVARAFYEARIEWTMDDRRRPPTEVVWVDRGPIEDAIASAPKGSIVWYADRAQEEIARESDGVFYAPGEPIDLDRLEERADERVFLSSNSHQKGWNLQCRRRMVVLSPSSGAAKWEQLLGRVHRNGQKADQIDVEVYTHGPLKKRLDNARIGAKFLYETTGSPQKLLAASVIQSFSCS